MDDKKILLKIKEIISNIDKYTNKLEINDNLDIKINDGKIPENVFYKIMGNTRQILKLRLPNSDYLSDYEYILETIDNNSLRYGDILLQIKGILESVYDCIKDGFIDDLFYKQELILFNDLLEQGKEFLNKNQLLPAAIYGRIVLETTIKEYARKNDIIEDSFEKTIQKLKKENHITLPFEQALRANYSIGTSAAHYKEDFKKMTKDEISFFITFIQDRVLTLT